MYAHSVSTPHRLYNIASRILAFRATRGLTIFLLGLLFMMAGIYIYFLNEAIVHSLAIERAEKQMLALEEEIRSLETDVASVAVGAGLEERALELGLLDEGPVHFIEREKVVAKANVER